MNQCLSGVTGSRRRLIARLGGVPALPTLFDGPPITIGEGGETRKVPEPGWEERAAREIDQARRDGADILTPDDARYPALLRVCPDPPLVLYVRGAIEEIDALAVAVVGSRRATPYGESMARDIAFGLAQAGFTVVSGLARGIDAAGHRAALEAGGRTIAVLGSGLDRIYPREHESLAGAIAARGAVVTELPFGSAPLARNFPERNRIIAWMSWATVVVEAAHGSGSLITADLAADGGRMVYAVPGSVGEKNAEGTNALLRAGALMCRNAPDVLEDLAPQVIDAARALGAAPAAVRARNGPTARGAGAIGATEAQRARLTEPQRRALDAVPKRRGADVDSIGAAAGLEPGALLAALLELELLGLVRQLPGRRFTAAACKN